MIQVTFAEEFVNDLAAVVLVDSFLSQEHQHFVLVDVAVAIDVDGSEFVVKLALLVYLAHCELLALILHASLFI